MPRKSKIATDVIPKLERGLRKESTGTEPVIDGEELALTRFLRKSGVDCTTHSKPALAKLIVAFLRHRRRH
ncbi:MAG: hypothetical protein AB7H70_09980 [Rhodospirillaceae bacterium]